MPIRIQGRRHPAPLLESLEDRRLLSGDYLTSTVLGAAGDERIVKVLVDTLDNRIVLGTFTGTCDFAPGKARTVLTSNGGADVFVAKYSPTGRLVWARQLGGKGDEEATGLAFAGILFPTDRDGVIVTGAFTGTADFNPGRDADLRASNGKADAFVWCLSAAGKLNWARNAGGAGYDVANGVTTDGSGHVYVGGSFRDTVNFRTGKAAHLFTSRGARDAFVWKLSASAGLYGGLRQLGGAGDDAVTAMAFNPFAQSRVFVAGYFSGGADFGWMDDPDSDTPPWGGQVTAGAVGADDVFLLGLATDSGMSLKSFEQRRDDRTARVVDVVASRDHLHLALNVGDPGHRDVLLWSTGYFANPALAAITIHGTGDTTAAGLATDQYNNLYLAGTFTGSLLGHATAGGTDILFARYALADLALAASASYGGTSDDTALALGHHPNPDVLVLAGAFAGTTDLDPSPTTQQLRTSQGRDDAYLLQVTP